MRHAEDDIQAAIFEYAQFVPELALLFAIPNGGKRNIREARRLKKQGVKPGVPDIFLPLPIPGQFAGLWIEVKAGKNTTTPAQREWIRQLNAAGYRALCCNGLDAVISALDDYVKTYRKMDHR